jgi:DsbC/DsbD-like thiol-disulfide interchange protein
MNTLFAITTIAALTMGAPVEESEVIKLSLPKEVSANATVAATVTVIIPEGWHAYQNPPLDKFQQPITITSPDKNVVIKGVKYPKGHVMDSFGKKAAVYEGTIKIPVSVVFKKPGKQTAEFKVLYMQCNDSTCMPPKFVKITAPVTVKAAKTKGG